MRVRNTAVPGKESQIQRTNTHVKRSLPGRQTEKKGGKGRGGNGGKGHSDQNGKKGEKKIR